MDPDSIKRQLDAMGDGAYLSTDRSPRAHRVVMRSAREFCAELYDIYAQKWPDFYKVWPSQNEFVRRHWPHFIGAARATLARLLGTNLDEKLKIEIHDALIRDHSLAPTRSKILQVKMDI